jgi:hypothetical protein
MSRQRYIQDPETLRLVPAEEYQTGVTAGYYIQGDIQPYKSSVTGELIQSRSKHREHLRQHNLVEVGNEKPVARPLPTLPGAREALVETCRKMKVRGFT